MKRLIKFASAITITIIIFVICILVLGDNAAIPQPLSSCSINMEWNGILPGKSNYRDVINQLGTPNLIGLERFGKKVYIYFGYNTKDEIKIGKASNRIYFSDNGKVDLIELPKLVKNYPPSEIKDISDIIGNNLDTVYMNNNYDPGLPSQYDILGGPEQVYVWSNCGIALLGSPYCHKAPNDKVSCESTVDNNGGTDNNNELKATHEPIIGYDDSISYESSALLLIEYIFPATNYDYYKSNYMFKIRYYGDFNYFDGVIKEYNGN
jgi:hypothetical protein